MRKILIAPLLIITTIVLIIWVIYPIYTADPLIDGGGVREKKLVLKGEGEKMDKVGGVKASSEALYSEINSNPIDKKVLFDYIPKDREEEKLIESVDSLASENSLFVVNISVLDTKEEALASGGAETLLLTPLTEDGILDPIALEKAKEEKTNKDRISPKNLDVNVSVVGGYLEIKSFINKMYGLKRFNQVHSMLVKKLQETNEKGEDVSSNKLQADMVFRFNYIKEVDKVNSFDVNNPVFGLQSFDKSILDAIRKKNIEVVNVELKQDGSTNPFTN